VSTSSLYVDGCFLKCGAAVRTSFRRGVALVLDGVDAEDVVIDSVADVDAASNSLRIRRRRALLIAVANAAVRVDFRIFTDATHSSSSLSSISLAEQLSRSVNDGSLVVALASSGLTNVTGISVVSLQDVDGDEKSDRLGQSAVAGIASGCVAFVAVSIFCAKRNAFRRGVRIARLVQEHQRGRVKTRAAQPIVVVSTAASANPAEVVVSPGRR